jgi:hypothetical protein
MNEHTLNLRIELLESSNEAAWDNVKQKAAMIDKLIAQNLELEEENKRLKLSLENWVTLWKNRKTLEGGK